MRAKRNLSRRSKLLSKGSLALAAGAVVGGAGADAVQVHANTQTSGEHVAIHSQASSTPDNIASTSASNSSSTSSGSKGQHQDSKSARRSDGSSVDPQFGPLAGHPSAKIIASTYGYQIQSGDNLPGIAAAHHVTQTSIVNDNPGVDFNHLIAGTQLRIPHNGMTNHRMHFTFTPSGLVVNAGNVQSSSASTGVSFDSVSSRLSQYQAAQASNGVQPEQSVQNTSRSSVPQSTMDANQIPTQNSGLQHSAQTSAAPSSNAGIQQTEPSFIQRTQPSVQKSVGQSSPVRQLHTANSTQTVSEHNNDLRKADTNSGDRTTYQVQRTAHSIVPQLSPRESAARAWIVARESGGNYQARNGHMIGKYQLTDTYLHHDYSPANQERTAQRYVQTRYGNWVNARGFWQVHRWY